MVENLAQNVVAWLPRLLAALAMFFGAWYLAGWAARGARRALAARQTDPEISLLLARLTRWSIIGLGAVLALEQIAFDLTAFLAGLGIVGFAIGFALQDVSKNFIAGVLLLLQQPFDLGDVIEVEGYTGTVTHVSLRATSLRTVDGLLVLIPNADVYMAVIKNLTRTPRRRIELPLGVAYDSDLNLATQTALAALEGLPGLVTDDPAPQAVFQAFGESSIDLAVYFWIDLSQTGYLDAQDAAIKAIKAAFDQAGIEIPFPTLAVLAQNQGAQL